MIQNLFNDSGLLGRIRNNHDLDASKSSYNDLNVEFYDLCLIRPVFIHFFA